jgi:hypothetical protein
MIDLQLGQAYGPDYRADLSDRLRARYKYR